MFSNRQNLLSTAALLPMAIVLATGGALAATTVAQEPAAPSVTSARANPDAVQKWQGLNEEAVVRVAAACTPCAAKKVCNPCNPCAAQKAAACNPCNPCAAKKACNPCNPCAAAKKAVNPCAAAQ
jgi:hypothetical protein